MVLCVRKRFLGEGVVVLPGNDAFHLVDASHYSHDRKSCALTGGNRGIASWSCSRTSNEEGPAIALGVVAEAYVFYRGAWLRTANWPVSSTS